jgi:UDP-N-acetylmuramyl pentapeptide phosphotransferase/UDP-N-acetylglucosamine-1-phosphate transferase
MAVIPAFVIAALVTPVAAWCARRLGIVDRPGQLKPQKRDVPYLGGVAVLAALAGPVAVEHPSALVPLGLACGVGLADDIGELPAPVRLVLELVVGVAAAVVFAEGMLHGALTIAFVVVLLNAVNLLDGLDGLAAGVAAVSALGFSALLDGSARVLGLALAGALAGFLLWNRPPARIYLGDAGSYLVGTALAMLLAASFADGQGAATSSAALLLVGVPVADMTIAIVRRWRAQRPLFEGDRGHVYDQLVDRGWRIPVVVTSGVLAQAALVIAGLGIAEASTGVAIVATGVVVAGVGLLALVVFTSPDSWFRNDRSAA